jgi:pyruvate dehydrogenase E2 component (dihydrolipoamide acetyltransferase)
MKGRVTDMAVEVIMPKMGMSMKEGTVVEWLIKKDEFVEKGGPVAVISSDKIEKEIEAPEKGFLIKIEAEQDDIVPVGKAIGFLGEKGEKVQSTASENSDIESSEQVAASVEAPEKRCENRTQTSGLKTRISPAARKMAKSHDIDIETVEGTGPKGRITRADIEQLIQDKQTKNKEPQNSEKPSNNKFAVEDEAADIKTVSGIRKVIANRMYDSLQQSAQLTITSKADVTELLTIQKQARANHEHDSDVKLTITDFIAQATILALISHRNMNSTFLNDQIHTYRHVHLGMAVALENGLMVPVIRNADTLDLRDISRQIRSLSQKARNGDLSEREIKGSTFSITSLGAHDIEFFTPVLNPPESGILGIGKIQSTPVFVDEKIERHELLPLSLTFDHRVIDGVPASQFLSAVKRFLERPYRMLI